MKKRMSVMGLPEYAIQILFFGVCAIFLYRAAVFRVLPGLSLAQSNWIFWGTWLLSLLSGALLTPQRGRTVLAALVTGASSLGIYLILSSFQFYRTFFTVTFYIIGVLLIVYFGFVLAANLHRLRSRKYRRKSKGFFWGILHRARMIVNTGLALLLLVFFINLFLGRPLMTPLTAPTNPKVNEETISGNMDTILLLQEDQWATLTPQQRLDVLQTVANIEASHLGLPHELNVSADFLEDSVLGCYREETHSITVDVDYLTDASAQDLLEVVAHEAFHAYEKKLVDLYYYSDPETRNLLLFQRIEEYLYNFENYIDSDDDYLDYYTQAIELDSTRYAIGAVIDYLTAIEEYQNDLCTPTIPQ